MRFMLDYFITLYPRVASTIPVAREWSQRKNMPFHCNSLDILSEVSKLFPPKRKTKLIFI